MAPKKPSNKSKRNTVSKSKARAFRSVSTKQLRLPAGFSADGTSMVTLADVLSDDVPTRELAQLTLDQQAELTAERIKRQPKYKMGMVGFGVLDKERAIAEVKGQTEVGRTLVEIENRTLRMLIEMAKGKRP